MKYFYQAYRNKDGQEAPVRGVFETDNDTRAAEVIASAIRGARMIDSETDPDNYIICALFYELTDDNPVARYAGEVFVNLSGDHRFRQPTGAASAPPHRGSNNRMGNWIKIENGCEKPDDQGTVVLLTLETPFCGRTVTEGFFLEGEFFTSDDHVTGQVLAWMPMPEPYKEK